VQPQPLIHAVVQETMILVAHLATAGGVRAPVARIANQVFAELAEQLSAQGAEKHVEALVSAGLVEKRTLGQRTLYESLRFDVPVGQSEGWEAAVLDHFQAVVRAICVKLRLGASRSTLGEAVGGSTYTFDVWRGHPLEHEARSTLTRLREQIAGLRERIDRYNATHPQPPESSDREVTVYVGQFVKTNDDDDSEERNDA